MQADTADGPGVPWKSRYFSAAAVMLVLAWSAAVSAFFISADKAVDDIAREQVVWSALQSEVEFHRLISAVDRGRAEETQQTAEQVNLHTDILISRLKVHDSGGVGARLRESSIMNEAVEGVRSVIGANRAILTDFDKASDAERAAVSAALSAYEGTMRRGAREVSSQESSRLRDVRGRIRIGRGLVIAATALVVLGAALFFTTLRRAVRRAEALAARNHRLAVHAEAGRRAKADFLATMSHEIRTPLNGVLGMLSALEDSGLREDQESYARIARSSATSLLALLSEVLDDVRLEEGRLTLSHEPTRLADLFADVFAIIAPRAWEERIELTYAIDPALPDSVMADAGRLRQVLLNLASNAVKFTREGGVAGWARLEETPDGKRLLIEVADSGPGVSSEDTTRIFGRFDRAHAAERMDGVGLGLAISARLVGAFGGEIGVRPREEGGSIFWFAVPLVPVATLPEDQPTAGPPKLDGKSIVFLRSSMVGPSAMPDRLRDLGAEVLTAVTTREAVTMMEAGGADAVMLIGDERADAMAHDILDQLPPGTRVAVLRCDPPRGARDARLASRGAFVSSTPFATDGFRFLAGERGPGAGDAEQAAGKRLDGMEVLISEDQPVNQMVVAMHLRREAANPTLAGDGAEAVDLASRSRFDAILLDLHTPRMNGVEAARTIRTGKGPNANTPIIALTADATDTARKEFLAVGVELVATKPVSREALARIILRAMGREAKEPAAETHDEEPQAVAIADPRLGQRAAAEFVRLAERLEGAAGDGDSVAVRAACHDAIGAAGFLGLDDLSELAEMVRVAAVENDPVWVEAANDLGKALREADPRTFRA